MSDRIAPISGMQMVAACLLNDSALSLLTGCGAASAFREA